MADFKARPTTYRGTKMRSRLEAGFAAWLDEIEVPWEYEPCAFASEEGQYLPDFRVPAVVRGQHTQAYVEVKPRQPDFTYSLSELIGIQPEWPNLARLARQMAVVKESEPDAAPMLIWPGLADDGAVTFLVLTRVAAEVVEAVGASWIFMPNHASVVGGRLNLVRPLRRFPWPGGYWQVQ